MIDVEREVLASAGFAVELVSTAGNGLTFAFCIAAGMFWVSILWQTIIRASAENPGSPASLAAAMQPTAATGFHVFSPAVRQGPLVACHSPRGLAGLRNEPGLLLYLELRKLEGKRSKKIARTGGL